MVATTSKVGREGLCLEVPLRALVVEDSPDDALLLLREIKKAGYELSYERVETAEAMEAALDGRVWDVIIADYRLPAFSAPAALEVLRRRGMDVPLIIVSGKVGEEAAVEAMRAGARDYVRKDNVARLTPAIERELREAEARRERRRAEEALSCSESSLARAQRVAHVGNWDYDVARDEARCSDELYRIFGFAPQEFVPTYKAFLNLVHPEDRKLVRETVREALYGKDRSGIDYRIVRPDGEVRFVDTRYEVVRGPSRQPARLIGTIHDVTERKRAEDALRKSEERFRSLVRHASDMIAVLDAGGTILYESPAVERVLGYRPEERVGTNAFMHLHPDDSGPVRNEFDRFLGRFGDYLAVEYRTRNREGAWRHFEAIGTNMLHDEVVRGIVVNSRDITERKRAEEELKKSEERYRKFIEQSTEGIWRCELDKPVPVELPEEEQMERFYLHGYLAECNDAMARMYGFSRAEELVGARLGDLLPHSDADNVEYIKNFIRSGYRLADAESREVAREGTHKFFLNNLTGIVEGGFLVRAWGTQRDVTESRKVEQALRHSEELYRTVIEQAAENIFLVDAETKRILQSNAALQRSLGYAEKELRQMALHDIVAHDRKSVDSNTDFVLEDEPRFLGERRYRRKDGSLVDVEVSASIISYGGRETLCVVAHDLTERKRTEGLLREAKEAEQFRLARDLHDTVLQDLAHAVQQIGIRQIMAEAEGSEKDAQLEEIAEDMKRGVESLRAAIFELRLEGDTESSFVDSLEALVDLNRRMARKRFAIGMEVAEGFPQNLSETARVELTRIVQEALSNARRHSGASRVQVSLGVEGGDLWVEVCDDGRGFDPQLFPGGLGTSSMHRRASGLGGEVEIESQLGGGTRVRFRAPSGRLVGEGLGIDGRQGDPAENARSRSAGRAE